MQRKRAVSGAIYKTNAAKNPPRDDGGLRLPGLIAAAHALVGGFAGIGHGRGLDPDAVQAATAFLVVVFAAFLSCLRSIADAAASRA